MAISFSSEIMLLCATFRFPISSTSFLSSPPRAGRAARQNTARSAMTCIRDLLIDSLLVAEPLRLYHTDGPLKKTSPPSATSSNCLDRDALDRERPSNSGSSATGVKLATQRSSAPYPNLPSIGNQPVVLALFGLMAKTHFRPPSPSSDWIANSCQELYSLRKI
jgi:hypothetical protein